MMSNWGARPTPDVMYTLTYKAGAAWNETYWDNARFNELLLMGKGELDDTRSEERRVGKEGRSRWSPYP